MFRVELLQQVRENFVAKAADVARQAAGMQVVESPHFLRVDCGLASDTFNVVVTRRLEGADLSELVRSNVAYFQAKRFPAAFWVWDSRRSRELASRLLEVGLESNETDVAMAAQLPVSARRMERPRDFEIRAATAPPDVELFGSIMAGLFGDSPESRQVAAYYSLIAQRGLQAFPRMRLYLGFHQGQAVSAGALFLEGANAGIYDLATRQEHRRKGFGTAVFRHLLAEGVQTGCSRGVLQASPDGLEIYRRAGFQPVGEVRVFENRQLFVPSTQARS